MPAGYRYGNEWVRDDTEGGRLAVIVLHCEWASLSSGSRFADRRGRVTTDEAERPFLDGNALEAGLVVMEAGPWLGGMFRRTVHPMSRVVRQDVLYTSTPECETAYDAAEMPWWVDHGYGAYGTPSVEGWRRQGRDRVAGEGHRPRRRRAGRRRGDVYAHPAVPAPSAARTGRLASRRPEGMPDRDDAGHPLHRRLPPRA